MRCVIVVVNEGRRSGSKSSGLFLLFFFLAILLSGLLSVPKGRLTMKQSLFDTFRTDASIHYYINSMSHHQI